MAASGGRMGGSSFSSSSSSDSSSSSSYSSSSWSESPSYSSYSSSSSTPSWDSSSLWSESSSSSSESPSSSSSLSASTSCTTMSPTCSSSYASIGRSLFFILMSLAAFVLVWRIISNKFEVEKTSVVKLQVGLLGLGRTIQGDLNRIAEAADTSTPTGLSYILTETILALLRHPDCCISAYSSVDTKRGMEDVEKHFNQLSIEERGKFDEETLVNVNNIKRQTSSTRSQKIASGFSNEYIVITILVAARGLLKLPAINGSGDLKEALQKLGSLPTTHFRSKNYAKIIHC